MDAEHRQCNLKMIEEKRHSIETLSRLIEMHYSTIYHVQMLIRMLEGEVRAAMADVAVGESIEKLNAEAEKDSLKPKPA